ncbi:MAG: ribonuclease J [bacterium]|nr:ribonuclease J [bacterium]
MSNDTNEKNDKQAITDFSKLVPENKQYKPAQDNVQNALTELKQNLSRKSKPPFRSNNERNPAPFRQGETRSVVSAPPMTKQMDSPLPPQQNDNRAPNSRSNAPRSQGRGGFTKPRNDRFPRRDFPVNSRPMTPTMPNRLNNKGLTNVNLTQQWIEDKTPVLRKSDSSLKDGATLKIIPVGGILNVQKNMFVYETENDIIIIDCGIGFADENMPGVDFLIPDASYLNDKKDKIRALFVTHGHDDHIGAIPYVWPHFKVPIYASRITAGFIKMKLTEHNLPIDQITEIDPDGVYTLGDFRFQFFRLSHSIPDSLGFVIDTPVGRIVHSADFKFDWTPVVGVPTDVQRIAQFSSEGVLALLSDSLGAEKLGYTLSERVIESQFDSVVVKTQGKIIITTTSSNISRIQLAMTIASKYNKKVAISGRSMDQNIGVARNLGYLQYSDDLFVELDDIGKYDDNELLLLVAGSQGQIESALSRIAHDEHKQIKLRNGDCVIFSTDPIPGNENQSNALIDKLISRGAEVYYTSIFHNLHVSGHAAQEELKLMLALVRPLFALPIGGTERSMKKYSELAVSMGFNSANVLLPNDGDIIEFVVKGGVAIPKLDNKIQIKDIMVDGLGIGDISDLVIRDRQVMAEEGMLVVIVPVDSKTGHTEGGVEIVSRGFVYMKESGELIDDIAKLVEDILEEQKDKPFDWMFLRKKIEERVGKFIFKEIKRKPMILPVVFEM